MNKKTNTALFILAGTVFNILITIISFLVFLIIYTKFFHAHSSENSLAWVLPVIFISSIIASFLIYRMVIKLIQKKVDMHKYFSPIFGDNRHRSKDTNSSS